MKFPIPVYGIKTPTVFIKAFDTTMCHVAVDAEIADSLRDPMEVRLVYHDYEDPKNDRRIFSVNHEGTMDLSFSGWYYQYWILDDEDGDEPFDGNFGPFDSPEEAIKDMMDSKRSYPQIVIET